MARKTRSKRTRSARSGSRGRPEAVPGYTFDQARADRVCGFLESVVTMTEGRWAGKPMQLMPWQREFIESVYGWVDSAGIRRYRRAALWIPKKNGKSQTMAGLALYHLLADNEPGAFVAVAACDRIQAGIIFRAIAASVRASPFLSEILEVVDSRSTIVHKASGSRIVSMSADAHRAEGINASAVIVDELHAHRKPDLVRALIYSGAARTQPLVVAISTAGADRNGIGYEWWKDSEMVDQVRGDPSTNPTFYARIYAADPEDPRGLADPEVWREANPSLGTTIDEKAFASDYADSLTIATKRSAFLRYRLNIWVEHDGRWFDSEKWAACGGEPVEPLEGRPCWVGVDIADNTDMTAAAFLFRSEDGTYDVAMRYWVPEDTVGEAERRRNLPYSTWIREGLVIPTPGARLDHEAVARDIVAFGQNHRILGIASDPWNVGPLATFLQREGFTVTSVPQNTKTLNVPSKMLEGLVVERKLRHAGHAVLAFNANNVCCYSDATGCIKPEKKGKDEKIDGIAALVNAMALASTASNEAESWDLVEL